MPLLFLPVIHKVFLQWSADKGNLGGLSGCPDSFYDTGVKESQKQFGESRNTVFFQSVLLEGI